MVAEFLLGLDIGTSGAKAVVVDGSGTVLGAANTSYPVSTPAPGIAEQDPNLWWEAACQVIPGALRAAHVNAHDVAAVGASALSPACLLIDHAGRPLANAHIWMDRRAISQAERVRATIGADRVFAVSGNALDPFYGLVKLLWEVENRPYLIKEASYALSATGWATFRLTERATLDHTTACLLGVAFDIRRLIWDETILEQSHIPVHLLPPLVPCDAVVGEVTRSAAAECALAPGTPVIAGLVDGSAVCAGTGMYECGDSVIFLGSSACLFVVHTAQTFAPGLIHIVHPLQPLETAPPGTADPNRRYTAVGAMVGGGIVLRYLRDTAGQPEITLAETSGEDPYDLMTSAAARVPAGSEGLVLLPYLAGERTPVWDARASGVLFGLRLHHTRAHLFRAGMEGVAFGLRHNLDMLLQSGLQPREPVRIAEGGARSALWRQIVADVLGLRLSYAGATGGASLGAALLAGKAVGLIAPSVWQTLQDAAGHETVPQVETRTAYDAAYRTYRALYPALKQFF